MQKASVTTLLKTSNEILILCRMKAQSLHWKRVFKQSLIHQLVSKSTSILVASVVNSLQMQVTSSNTC